MVETCGIPKMSKGDGQLGKTRGRYKIVPTDDDNKTRAISLLQMFKDRIENGQVKVEIADWWSKGDISTLRIDILYLDNS